MKHGMHFLFLLLLWGQFVLAAPTTITYSSFLTDVNKKPRAISDFVTFRLFDDSVGGTKLWEEELKVVAPNGFVSAVLGAKTTFPIRQITGSNKLFLEMQIGSESPFSRQKISNSFFAFSSAYSDSARHSLLADSSKTAGRALVADTANTAKALGVHAAAEYVLQTLLNSFVPDSSKNARNSDSLGEFSAAVYAKKTGKIDSARVALRSDSLGAFSAGSYTLKSGKIDSARTAQRADSLGMLPAARYLKTDANGKTMLDSGLVLNSGAIDLRNAAFFPKFKVSSDAGMPQIKDGEMAFWYNTNSNILHLMFRYGNKIYYFSHAGTWVVAY